MALTDKLTAIADALRSKTGGTAQLTLEQIASGISGLDTSGSGGTTPTVPDIAKYWQVGSWALNGTSSTETKTQLYFAKKMATGATITNNTTTDVHVSTVAFDSSGKVIAKTTAKQLPKGSTMTLSNSSAHYLLAEVHSQISVYGNTTVLPLNAFVVSKWAMGLAVTYTEVS